MPICRLQSNGVTPVQDRRISIEYSVVPKPCLERGWLEVHERHLCAFPAGRQRLFT